MTTTVDGVPPAADDSMVRVMQAAFDAEFEEFADSSAVRRAVRFSIQGKVKRRTILQLGFAHGCKSGAGAQMLVCRGTLAHALGLPLDSEWAELLTAVRGCGQTDTNP